MADDSHEISYLIFFRKLGKISQNLSSAAAVIGALRVNLDHRAVTGLNHIGTFLSLAPSKIKAGDIFKFCHSLKKQNKA